jgi:hypothetical protein
MISENRSVCGVRICLLSGPLQSRHRSNTIVDSLARPFAVGITTPTSEADAIAFSFIRGIVTPRPLEGKSGLEGGGIRKPMSSSHPRLPDIIVAGLVEDP